MEKKLEIIMETGNSFRRPSFDPTPTISLCASLIEHYKEASAHSEREFLKDTKNLLKQIIRVASESPDFPRTVDFITKDVLHTLVSNYEKKGKFLRGFLSMSGNNGLKKNCITHEHMVPCEAIYQEVLKPNIDVNETLNALSYRALVTFCQRDALDREFKSTMPDGWNNGKRNVLARYRKVLLLNELIPITVRGSVLLKAK